MILALLPKREVDDYGSGEFGASRGSHTHTGLDFACFPGSQILSPADGTVTRFGYPYADDLSYRYVQITDDAGLDHRMFYVEPADELSLNDIVLGGVTIIGKAQDIAARYTDGKMNNHVHYEVKDGGEYLDPETLI